MTDLADARRRIDDVDARLLALLQERARIAQEVGRTKRGDGDEDGYRPGREAEVLRRALAANEGPLDDAQVARILREVMSACLHLESPLKVAYLGPAGTYTEAALYRFFGHGVGTVPVSAIDAIFREVEADTAHYGVVPVENSTEGAVTHTLDRFVDSPLRICGEVLVPVHHHLLAKAGTRMEDVTEVRAHGHSFGQCRAWLDEHMPGARHVPVSSNAEAARLVGELGGAAIASRVAADHYDLAVLAERIEDDPRNTTRFLVVGRRDATPCGADKTSIVLAAKDRPGALLDLLRPFADAGVNLTRIQSRPSSRSTWDYHFFIDMEGHIEDGSLGPVLEQVKEAAAFFKVLGSYPAAIV